MTFRPYNKITTSGVSDERSNNTGSVINKATPVRINNSGELDFIDVSIEADIKGSIGIVKSNISNGAKGAIISSGKVEDITTSAGFGDPMYIDKTGEITNIEPDIGVNSFVAGDFVVAVGVIAKNESNPILKDLIVLIDIRGQL